MEIIFPMTSLSQLSSFQLSMAVHIATLKSICMKNENISYKNTRPLIRPCRVFLVYI